jgi:predicted transcriptional regulator
MEVAINRRSTMFRLRSELVDRLKELAARDNRSLNNYVETILMDVAYKTPNATTLAAMKEAQDDSTMTPVNMDNYDSFIKSLLTE